MTRRNLFFTFLSLLLPVTAQAACSGAITSIALLESGPAVHITARDQSCNPLPPGNLSVTNGSFPACPTNAVGMADTSPTKISATPDATGLNFQSVSGATGMGACNVNVVYQDGTLTLSFPLSVSLSSGVVSISITSP
jgi:hypothetical protein